MAGLKTLLGIYPNTEAYENVQDKLQEELSGLLGYQDSEEFKNFLELKKYVDSKEFADEKAKLLALKYKGSEEYRLEQEYLKLAKNKNVILYLKTLLSSEYKNFMDVDGSKELNRFNELKKETETDQFKKVKKLYSKSAKEKFSASDLAETVAEYTKLSKNFEIRSYKKFTSDKNYEAYKEFLKTGKADRLADLIKQIESSEFKTNKAKLSKQEFQSSDNGIKLSEYKSLLSTPEYKKYNKLHTSSLMKNYQKMHGSPELEVFTDLEKFLNSKEFSTQKAAIENKSFKDTEEYKLEMELNALKASAKLAGYLKFISSKEYSNYKLLHNSETIQRHNKLKEQVESKEFQEKKAYLTLSGKVRWTNSEASRKFEEHKKLEASDKVKWYLKNIKSNKYDWYKKWELKFEDTFEAKNLDEQKWMPRYYWGDKMINDSYSLEDEKHCITNGKNLKFTGRSLQIETRKENASGKTWHNAFGFIPREFEYTSGLINSSKVFWQKYGTIAAKIKFSTNPDIQNAFWMVSEKMLPHIDIATAGKSILLSNKYTNSNSVYGIASKAMKRAKFSDKFFIFSLEWTEKKLVWKINGEEVFSTQENIPQEAMYVVLSSGLYKDVDNSSLPSTMEVDWIRCYQKNEA